jgi:hypothetical protein
LEINFKWKGIGGFGANVHPRSGWLAFPGPGGERKKHISALNGAIATGCVSMTIPCFVWDVQRFDPPKISGGLLTPATILGAPTEAGLNQKNSTSLSLGTQTAFDFYPPKYAGGQAPCYSRRLKPKMLNGARKNLSNLVLNCVTYLWDTTLKTCPLLNHRQRLVDDTNHFVNLFPGNNKRRSENNHISGLAAVTSKRGLDVHSAQ